MPITSSYGSGDFGRWLTDGWGLPAYRNDTDEASVPWARQPELYSRPDPTDAWSQVGNDHITADAFNHGYTELWSTDRQYQWANRYDASTRHYAGGAHGGRPARARQQRRRVLAGGEGERRRARRDDHGGADAGASSPARAPRAYANALTAVSPADSDHSRSASPGSIAHDRTPDMPSGSSLTSATSQSSR